MVGCDLRIGSNRQIDDCGACGGDGSCPRPLYHWTLTPVSLCSVTCGRGTSYSYVLQIKRKLIIAAIFNQWNILGFRAGTAPTFRFRSYIWASAVLHSRRQTVCLLCRSGNPLKMSHLTVDETSANNQSTNAVTLRKPRIFQRDSNL